MEVVVLKWIPIETRPLKTGYYIVGHSGHQEKLLFRGPDKEWMPRTILGWSRLDRNNLWIRDEPEIRFKATHCCFIDPPPGI